MKICCLLTGRGNNTLKDKNILDVLGRPVLYYGANAAAQSGVFDKLYCSSDDDKILNEAGKLGFEAIKRPTELATPNAQHIDCIYHALDVMGAQNYVPDILCVLLANNVTVTSQMIKDCVGIMLNDKENISAVVPVYNDNDHHPLRCKKLDINGNLVCYTENTKNISTNRQDLSKCYFLAHNFWVLNVTKVLNREQGDAPWAFLGKSVKPYLVEQSIDIHEPIDLVKAEYWIKENYAKEIINNSNKIGINTNRGGVSYNSFSNIRRYAAAYEVAA